MTEEKTTSEDIEVDDLLRRRLIAIVSAIVIVTVVVILLLIKRDGGSMMAYSGTNESPAGWNEIRIYNSGEVYCRGKGMIENDTNYEWQLIKTLTTKELADFREQQKNGDADILKSYIIENIGCYTEE